MAKKEVQEDFDRVNKEMLSLKEEMDNRVKTLLKIELRERQSDIIDSLKRLIREDLGDKTYHPRKCARNFWQKKTELTQIDVNCIEAAIRVLEKYKIENIDDVNKLKEK